MAWKTTSNRIPRLPKRSVQYLAFCFAGILIFFLAGLLPNQHQLATLDKEVERLKQAIQKQVVLYPVFQKALRTMQQREKKILPFPEKKRFPIARLGDLSSVFQNIAMESGLRCHEVVPDVNSLKTDAGHLRIRIVLRGDFIRFHDFLMRLGNLAYLEDIETITINSEGAMKEFGLQLWVWVE